MGGSGGGKEALATREDEYLCAIVVLNPSLDNAYVLRGVGVHASSPGVAFPRAEEGDLGKGHLPGKGHDVAACIRVDTMELHERILCVRGRWAVKEDNMAWLMDHESFVVKIRVDHHLDQLIDLDGWLPSKNLARLARIAK